MPDKDYYSFDEVLKNLRMEEDELKRLVSAGEIRAFRDQDTMRFKAADVQRLRATGSAPAGSEDLELDLGEELDLGDDLAVSEDLSGNQAPADDLDLGEDLVLEDDPDAGGADELDLAAATAGRGRAGAPVRSAARGQVVAEASDSPGLLFALAVGFVALIFANFAALGAVAGQTNALTGFLADIFSS